MENKKDILKQALAEMDHFANLVNESVNIAKGTIVKDQIKEALNEEEFDEEDVDVALDQDSEQATDGVDAGDIETEIEDADAEETETEIEDVPSADLDLGDADDSEIELEDEDYDVVDLTQAPNEEVIKVFKDMSNSDEIEIVGDEVNITDPESGNTYKIVTGGGAEEVPAETDVDADLDLDLDGEAEDTEDLDLDIDGFDDAEEDAEGEEADLDLDAEEDAEEAPAEDEETEDAEEDDEEIVFEVELNDVKKDNKRINESEGDMKKRIYSWIINNDYLQNAHEWYTKQTDFLEIGLTEFMEVNQISENQYEVLSELAEKVVNEIGYYQWSSEEEETLEEQIPVGNAQARRVTAAKEIKGAGAKQLAEEVAKLKAENAVLAENYANSLKALELFKERIIETKVHTKNLAAITKLFLEFTTTQAEKKQIVESLTSAKTIEESNAIEKRLISELTKKPTVNESVNKAINNNIATSTSKTVIQEAAYVDPQLARMRNMMGL